MASEAGDSVEVWHFDRGAEKYDRLVLTAARGHSDIVNKIKDRSYFWEM